MKQKALDSSLVGSLPLFVREQVMITSVSLGFYLKLSHSQETPLLDTAFLEVIGFPVYRAAVLRLAALWLVTHGSWTDRGHLLGLSMYQGSFSASPVSDGLFLVSHPVLEHCDGVL